MILKVRPHEAEDVQSTLPFMKYECVVQKSCVMVRVKAEWTTDRR
jgi:hypothetical protein